MNNYQEESLKAGATHYGPKGHGWRQHGTAWQVFKLGKGWVTEAPTSELTPLFNAMPTNPLDDAWQAVKRALAAHEASQTLGSLYDLREAVSKFDVLMGAE